MVLLYTNLYAVHNFTYNKSYSASNIQYFDSIYLGNFLLCQDISTCSKIIALSNLDCVFYFIIILFVCRARIVTPLSRQKKSKTLLLVECESRTYASTLSRDSRH